MTTPQRQSCSSLGYFPNSSTSNLSGIKCSPSSSIECLPSNGEASSIVSSAGFTNNWTNTMTYNRVTVEDLISSHQGSTKSVVTRPSSARSQLNPNANPFQPAYQRTQQLLPTTHPQHPTPPSSTQTVCNDENEIVQATLVNRNTTTNVFVSRGTMYFGEPTIVTNSEDVIDENTLVEDDLNVDASIEKQPTDSERVTEFLTPLPKKDIAKMMWEAADLYDNALKVIRSRRVQYGNWKQGILTATQDNSSDSAELRGGISGAVVRDIVTCPYRIPNGKRFGFAHMQQLLEYLNRNTFSSSLHPTGKVLQSAVRFFSNRKQRSNTHAELIAAHLYENGDSDQERTASTTETSRSSLQSVKYTFNDKVLDMDNAVDIDSLRRTSTSLQVSRKAVLLVVEEIYRYIAEQLQLNSINLVRVWMRSSSSLAHLTVGVNEGKTIPGEKGEKITLGDEMELCGTDKPITCRTDWNMRPSILNGEGRKMTVTTIFQAFQKLSVISTVENRHFIFSYSELIEFIVKKKRAIRALKQNSDSTRFEGLMSVNPLENDTSPAAEASEEVMEYSTKNLQRKPQRLNRIRVRLMIKPIMVGKILLRSYRVKRKRQKKERDHPKTKEHGKVCPEFRAHRKTGVCARGKCLTARSIEPIDEQIMVSTGQKAFTSEAKCPEEPRQHRILPQQNNDKEENSIKTEVELKIETEAYNNLKKVSVSNESPAVSINTPWSFFGTRTTRRGRTKEARLVSPCDDSSESHPVEEYEEASPSKENSLAKKRWSHKTVDSSNRGKMAAELASGIVSSTKSKPMKIRR